VQKAAWQELKGVVFDSDIDGEHVVEATRKLKLAATFQAVLELATGGFHRVPTKRPHSTKVSSHFPPEAIPRQIPDVLPHHPTPKTMGVHQIIRPSSMSFCSGLNNV